MSKAAENVADLLPPGDNAERLAARLGIEFHDPNLLRLALMHRSVVQDLVNANPDRALAPEARFSNERLEFLGDSVLGYVVADYLYNAYPDASEGTLTAQRAALVRAEQLVRWARELGLADVLYLGVGEKVTSGARDRMLAGGFEALVGAIALDRGLREARRFLRVLIDRDAGQALADEATVNAKGALQELAQERFRAGPSYKLTGAEGPDHERLFTVEVWIADQRFGAGSGLSKRVAEQAAAREALATLDSAPKPSKPTAERAVRRRRRPRAPVSSPPDASNETSTEASNEKEPAHVPSL